MNVRELPRALATLVAGFLAFLVLIYFPIPGLILLAGFLLIAKTRWLRPAPWPLLAMIYAGIAFLIWAVFHLD